MARNRTRAQLDKLREERKQVLADIEHWLEILKIEVDPDADEGDPDLIEREKAVALVQGLERRLESIDHALKQAAEGSYGICERCGEPIDPARLEIVPEATLCVKCKAIVERQTRAGATPAQFY